MKSSLIAVRAVIEAAEWLGLERATLLQRAGLDLQDAPEPYGWIDDALYDRLLCAAVELSGNPLFGLSWAQASRMLQFELIPILIANAPSLRHAVQLTLQMHGLLHVRPQIAFAEDEHLASLRVEPDPSFSPTAARVTSDFSMVCFKHLVRHFVGDDSDASYTFTYEVGADGEAYRAAFGDRTRFGSKRSELRFASKLLDASRPGHNPELFRGLVTQLEQLHARMSARLSHTERVKTELRRTLPRTPEMGVIASALGMSERSLRRRLSEEGTSYTDLVESGKIQLARELLSHPAAAIKSVAHELGFDTSSGFYRAFRRWTGVSPIAFKRGKARS